VEGLIVPGRSRRAPSPIPLPFTNAQAGAETVIQALRKAENDRQMAAVILHVDSPGGSALASDLIAREVRRLRESKPVVALMGAQAASGGYYVAAPANRIVARPTTITGSIGIWGGKFTLKGLYDKLGIQREALQQGAMAGLYSELVPFSPEERAWVRRDMGEFYARFKAYVAEGRGMREEKVELAGIKPAQDVGVVPVRAPRHELPPAPFPMGAEGLNLALMLEQIRGLARERVWAMAPWFIQVNT
jgi:protease-4